MLPAFLIVSGMATRAQPDRVRAHRLAIFQAGHQRINLANLAGDPCERCGDIGKQTVGIRRIRVPALQMGDSKQRDGELRANHDQFIVFRAIHGIPSHLGVRRHKT